ncbi:hypothetical protein SKAU_G00083710 [Synaphobranchus kaupii]|uniref:Uncharacterized protein n=1 Tax=Synaphobranchus kaupii TaxID=118154 RepID=A0A9Q1J5U2_SYNKA|nr:hypothetical protein SKAU_G00083710 [Synaphobranchus kaupii]
MRKRGDRKRHKAQKCQQSPHNPHSCLKARPTPSPFSSKMHQTISSRPFHRLSALPLTPELYPLADNQLNGLSDGRSISALSRVVSADRGLGNDGAVDAAARSSFNASPLQSFRFAPRI